MRVVYKKIIIFVLTLFASILVAEAQVGVGLWPAKINVNVPMLKSAIVDIYFFNPTQKELKLKVDFYCKNCEENISLFGHNIGKLVYSLDTKIYPSVMLIPNTSLNTSKPARLRIYNPVFLSASYQTSIFGKGISIPMITLCLDKKVFNGMVIAETLDGSFNVQIASSVHIEFEGINILVFILGVVSIVLFLTFYYRRKIKKELSRIGF